MVLAPGLVKRSGNGDEKWVAQFTRSPLLKEARR
jgi:hypothetical protein